MNAWYHEIRFRMYKKFGNTTADEDSRVKTVGRTTSFNSAQMFL